MDLKEKVAAKLAEELKLKSAAEFAQILEVPPDEKLGDYALPCFPFAKELKKAPPLIAKELVGKIKKDGLVEEVKVVGPYLNLFLNKENIINTTVTAVLEEKERYGAGASKAERVMIEYSQPNTHKAFHVGHLRGTSIGEALARILKHAGYDVIQANYSGDTGMHVAKWLWCYTRFHKDECPPKEGKGKWLASLYVEAVKKLEKEPELQEQVDTINRELEEGKEKALLDLWTQTRQWSIDEFDAIYDDLQAHFDKWWFEREMEAKGKAIAQELVKKGIARVSDGATIVDLEQYNLGVWVLLRKDGTVLYSAKDLALAEIKFNEHNIGRSIYVVGKAQALHMQQLFKTLELMEFKQAARCFHLSYEEVRLPDGKMSSRTGQNILYQEIKDEVFSYAEQEVRKRHEEWDEKEIAAVTKAVGVCALKFEMVYRDHNKPIVFETERVCDFEGDTGPYLQYTHARCNSILAKLAEQGKTVKKRSSFAAIASEHEFRLAKRLLDFPLVIEKVAATLYPEELAKYVLELAKTFNSFYHECKVLGEPADVENARALLVHATAVVLERSLFLLGIDAPKRM